MVPLEGREPCGVLGPSAVESCQAGGPRPLSSRVAFVLFQGQFEAMWGVVHLLETNTRYEL